MIKQKYDENSIESISPREFTRLRPGVYCGDTTYSTQLVREIFSNALDEHISGRCSEINISIDTINNIFTVEDKAQGFPINSYREDGETILQAAFDVMNTSGKYRNGTDESCYYGSVGTNGCGSKLTNFLSLWLEVISYDGNNFEKVYFSDGIFEKRETGKLKHSTGTTVVWQPDPQFFQNKEANISDLKKLFEEISALCQGLTINFKIDDELITYYTSNGIQDLLAKKITGKEILANKFYIKKELDANNLDIAITYSSAYSDNVIAYVNYGLTESGAHIAAVKAAMTRQINKYAKDNGLLKKTDELFTQAELSEGLFIIFNLKVNNVKYDSQTKVRIIDCDKTIINNVMNNDFVDWLNNNPKDTKIIIDKALLARKAREAAQKAKDNIRGASTKNKKFISLPTKLVDAYSKNRAECELYICEGNSAASGLIATRDGKTQAIFPIRGKILSCRKATTDKIYGNAEISNIVKAIGLDIDKSTGKLIYDKKKLRYGKIVLAADSDDDGLAIRSLLINMFWELCQDLVINGHIYVALPPLFRITTKKNTYIFLKDKNELEKYKKANKNSDYTISRNKGIGEQDPKELRDCILAPSTRHIEQIIVTDVDRADELLNCFFGTDVTIRRQYLLDHIDEFLSEQE